MTEICAYTFTCLRAILSRGRSSSGRLELTVGKATMFQWLVVTKRGRFNGSMEMKCAGPKLVSLSPTSGGSPPQADLHVDLSRDNLFPRQDHKILKPRSLTLLDRPSRISHKIENFESHFATTQYYILKHPLTLINYLELTETLPPVTIAQSV